MLRFLFLSCLLSLSYYASAQSDPVHWDFNLTSEGGKSAVQAKATIEDGWYVYSQFLGDGGPVPTTLTVTTAGAEHSGNARETGTALEGFDEMFGMNVKKFKNSATFTQAVSLPNATQLSGIIEFMACTDKKCLPPRTIQINVSGR